MKPVLAFALALSLCALSALAADDHQPKPVLSEVKVDVAPEQISAALSGLSLGAGDADEGDVYFFDGHDLSLFNRNMILRLRQGAKSDFTVKVRPIVIGSVDPSWFETKGFKCAVDVSRDQAKPQCALKTKVSDDQSGLVVGGKGDLSDLVTRDQAQFAGDYGVRGVDWNSLAPLGPVRSRTWEYSDKSSGVVDAELWTLPNGQRFLELSQDVTPGQESAARAALLALLARIGVKEGDVAENKTEFVMKYFANQAR